MLCANCSKSIRTDNGMAFHLGWCKPAEPSSEPIAPEPIAAEPIAEPVVAPKAPRRIVRRGRPVSANRPLCLVCRANYRTYAEHVTSQRHLRATRPETSRKGDRERPAWMVAMNSYGATGSTYDHGEREPVSFEPDPVWDGIPLAF